jgi:hypothetical protein
MIELLAGIGVAGGLWMVLLAFIVFGFLGYITYQDIVLREGDDRKKKIRENLYLLAGGIVLFILLKTVFAEPMTALANEIWKVQAGLR